MFFPRILCVGRNMYSFFTNDSGKKHGFFQIFFVCSKLVFLLLIQYWKRTYILFSKFKARKKHTFFNAPIDILYDSDCQINCRKISCLIGYPYRSPGPSVDNQLSLAIRMEDILTEKRLCICICKTINSRTETEESW